MRRRRTALALAAVVTWMLAPGAGSAPAASADDPIIVISGPAVVERGETVEGVFVVSGDARVSGTVTGGVYVLDGDVTVSGRIEEDLVTVGGRAELLPTARVDGDLLYGDEAPDVASAAIVGGEVSDEGWSDALDALPFISALALWLAVTASALVLGLVLVMLVPRAADAVFVQARSRMLVCVAFGAAIFVALPLAAVLAAITLVGLPLGVALLLALLPLAAIAYVTTAWALGRALVKDRADRVVPFLVGLAILRALALVPVLGALVWLAAVIVGLGLLAGALGASRERPTMAAAPAG